MANKFTYAPTFSCPRLSNRFIVYCKAQKLPSTVDTEFLKPKQLSKRFVNLQMRNMDGKYVRREDRVNQHNCCSNIILGPKEMADLTEKYFPDCKHVCPNCHNCFRTAKHLAEHRRRVNDYSRGVVRILCNITDSPPIPDDPEEIFHPEE